MEVQRSAQNEKEKEAKQFLVHSPLCLLGRHINLLEYYSLYNPLPDFITIILHHAV
jgi:hypothetical protein